MYINIAVLVVTTIYGLFWIILGSKKAYKIDRIFKRSKLILSAVSLGINAYSIYVTTQNFNLVSLIINLAMGAFWIFNVIFNILYDVASYKFHKFMIEKKADIEQLKANLIEKKNAFISKRQNDKSIDTIE